MNYTYEEISRMIDHSLLKPTLTFADFEIGCRMAVVFGEPGCVSTRTLGMAPCCAADYAR